MSRADGEHPASPGREGGTGICRYRAVPAAVCGAEWDAAGQVRDFLTPSTNGRSGSHRSNAHPPVPMPTGSACRKRAGSGARCCRIERPHLTPEECGEELELELSLRHYLTFSAICGRFDGGFPLRRVPWCVPAPGEKSMEIRIREANPADAGPMARVHVDTWRTEYAGILPAGHLALAWFCRTTIPPAGSTSRSELSVSEGSCDWRHRPRRGVLRLERHHQSGSRGLSVSSGGTAGPDQRRYRASNRSLASHPRSRPALSGRYLSWGSGAQMKKFSYGDGISGARNPYRNASPVSSHEVV